jgi:hypothetical protein
MMEELERSLSRTESGTQIKSCEYHRPLERQAARFGLRVGKPYTGARAFHFRDPVSDSACKIYARRCGQGTNVWRSELPLVVIGGAACSRT